MAKKRKSAAADEQIGLAHAVSASAQQIWQAGLGAFAATRHDGGKLFDALVQDGAQLHKLTLELGRGKVPDMGSKVGRLAEDVTRQAGASWEKLEQYFEQRVADALHRVGVPSLDEVKRLRHEVSALEAALRASAGARDSAKTASPANGDQAGKTHAKRSAPNGSAAKRPA